MIRALNAIHMGLNLVRRHVPGGRAVFADGGAQGLAVNDDFVDLRPQVFRSVSSHNRQVGFWPGTYGGVTNSFSTATASYQIFPFTG